MRKWLVLFVAVAVLIVAGSASLNAECTKDEVMKAVNYAADLLEKEGQAAFAELDKFRFCSGEGYVFIYDMNAVCLFHPISAILVGKDQTMIQDAKGNYLVAEMNSKAKDPGHGWVLYYWLNPVTNTVDPKCTYVKRCRMDGRDVWVASGVYGISEEECK
ncbi:MAG: cache domain-containing protein [Deltaproteobacteria bacterium]|nr:cache domain-containing protein [Deltaproteobacteria bacterium]